MPRTKQPTLKALNTPESKEHLIGRLLVESRGKPASVSVSTALEFRRQQYGLSCDEFAFILGVRPSHYNEVINGKREIPKAMMRRAFAIGVPADILLQPVAVVEPDNGGPA